MTLPLAIVTGAPGWLGSRLIESLCTGLPDTPNLPYLRERPIRALTFQQSTPPPGASVEWISGDVTRSNSLEALFVGAEGATVFHCAGIIHPQAGVKQFFEVNYQGTKNMLAAAAQAGVRRFVYVSSNSPLGANTKIGESFDEHAAYNPYLNYGRSKKLAEDLVNEYSAAKKIETVIIRPPWFYGPGQPARQTLFFSMIKQGKFPIVGNGLNQRSMAFIDNICQGLLLSELVDKADGQTYWIADRRPYSMNEIIATVKQVLIDDFRIPCASQQVHLPSVVSDLAYLADFGLQSLGIYQQKIHVLSEMNKKIACSIEKAVSDLGYCPQVELQEGMRRSIAWVLSQGIKI